MGIFTEIDIGKLHDHTFFDLTDTPSSSGSGEKYIRIKLDETGLEYVNISTVSGVSIDEVTSAIITFSGTIDHNTILNTHNLTTDIDHGIISGIMDDDHIQYILVDGTRAFSSTVSGVSPTENAHLATKGYIDDAITTATGSFTGDHGDLYGLSDDDHTQYILVNGIRSFSSTVSGIMPTMPDHLSTKEYIDTEVLITSGTLQNQITSNTDNIFACLTSTTTDGGIFTLNEAINLGEVLCKDKTVSGGTFSEIADILLDGGSF